MPCCHGCRLDLSAPEAPHATARWKCKDCKRIAAQLKYQVRKQECPAWYEALDLGQKDQLFGIFKTLVDKGDDSHLDFKLKTYNDAAVQGAVAEEGDAVHGVVAGKVRRRGR